MILLEITGLLG